MVKAKQPPTSVMIATPTIDGRLDYRFVSSLMRTFDLLRAKGIAHTVNFEVGNSLIADARNRLVRNFLNSDYTDLLFIDSDIGWEPESVLRLLSWQTPLVAGVYPKKRDDVSFVVKFGATIQARGELLTADRVGTGFMRIHRDCLSSLVKAHPEWQMLDEDGQPGKGYYAVFNTAIVDGVFVSEDYLFCDRWRELGGEVLIDPQIPLDHIGTRIFNARIRDYLKRNA